MFFIFQIETQKTFYCKIEQLDLSSRQESIRVETFITNYNPFSNLNIIQRKCIDFETSAKPLPLIYLSFPTIKNLTSENLLPFSRREKSLPGNLFLLYCDEKPSPSNLFLPFCDEKPLPSNLFLPFLRRKTTCE